MIAIIVSKQFAGEYLFFSANGTWIKDSSRAARYSSKHQAICQLQKHEQSKAGVVLLETNWEVPRSRSNSC